MNNGGGIYDPCVENEEQVVPMFSNKGHKSIQVNRHYIYYLWNDTDNQYLVVTERDSIVFKQ